ncbi:MAG: selenium-dependent molybdenum cofactor biosynthesis protein YqeB [Anaerolineae bacterium]
MERDAIHCPACGVDIAEWEQSHTYTERLVHALRHPNPEARMSAIITLGNRGDAGAALPLAECALAHPLDVTQGLAVVESIRRLPRGAEKQAALRLLRRHPSRLIRQAVESRGETNIPSTKSLCNRRDSVTVMIPPELVIVRGAGELGSAVAWCLHTVGFRVLITEAPEPMAVRRTVAFCDAVYDGRAQVEGVTARLVKDIADVDAVYAAGDIALLVDPDLSQALTLAPLAVVDAIMAKTNVGTRMDMAPIVIGLGPGLVAGRDVHAVIETNRGHYLGHIIWEGSAQPDTGVPAPVEGHAEDRVLRAPAAGRVHWDCAICSVVRAGQVLGEVAGQPILAPFDGVLRGAIREGTVVSAGLKIGDVDPRLDVQACFTISDKARALACSTLHALLILARRLEENC